MKKNMNRKTLVNLLIGLCVWLFSATVSAHHILGRPAYSLNEDSNTPPSMNLEAQIGNYLVTAMVFPAFPRPNEPGRINFYATHLDSKQPLNTKVEFIVKDDSWFSTNAPEVLGAQVLDDNVYRQGFVFKNEGNYIITAKFEAENEPYTIDFPMRVGNPMPIGLLGSVAGGVLLLLLGVTLFQRKRLARSQRALAREEKQREA